MTPDVEAEAVGDRILEAGAPYGLRPISIFGSRRIEAGLLNAGSDFDSTTTPFAVGLGQMIDFDKGDFLGRDALSKDDPRRRLWGMKVDGSVPRSGSLVRIDGQGAGSVCSSAWSPYLRCGVAFVLMDSAEHGPGTPVDAECTDGDLHAGELCETPMYDRERNIPRGRLVDIPTPPCH